MKNILILIALAAIICGSIVNAIMINDDIRKVLVNINHLEPEVNKHAKEVERLASKGFLQGDYKLPAYKKAEIILIKSQYPLQKLQNHFEHLNKMQLLNLAVMLILVISTWWFYNKKINRIKSDIVITKKVVSEAVISTTSVTTKTATKYMPQILKHISQALKYIPQILVIAIGIALGLTIYTTFKF